MSADLRDNVEQWLQKTGFPFEMAAARAFRRAGLLVNQSVYYRDADSATAREIDLVATKSMAVGENLTASVHLVAECKVTTQKPWLLYTSGTGAANPALPVLDAARLGTDRGIAWFRRAQHLTELGNLEILQVRPKHAYALGTAHLDDRKDKDDRPDLAYAATMSAVKAARALAEDEAADPVVRQHALFFPALVLRGYLYEVELDDTDELRIRPVDRGQLIWRNRPTAGGVAIVDVVTERALPAFAEEFRAMADILLDHGSQAVWEVEQEEFSAVY